MEYAAPLGVGVPKSEHLNRGGLLCCGMSSHVAQNVRGCAVPPPLSLAARCVPLAVSRFPLFGIFNGSERTSDDVPNFVHGAELAHVITDNLNRFDKVAIIVLFAETTSDSVLFDCGGVFFDVPIAFTTEEQNIFCNFVAFHFLPFLSLSYSCILPCKTQDKRENLNPLPFCYFSPTVNFPEVGRKKVSRG